jgi:hypothetical protein
MLRTETAVTDPDAPAVTEPDEPRPLDALMAGIDAAVDGVRTARVSGREFRRLALERGRAQRGAYDPIRVAALMRGV